MSAARDFSQADWRLKFRRAEHHFKELEANICSYCDGHFYEAERASKGDQDPDIWLYVLRITKQPGPEIALPMGDVVHNLRAALDYLASALAPEGAYTTFPILTDDETRTRFDHLVRGMASEAVAIIEELQPRVADEPHLHPLAVLSRLDNADKHRNLVLGVPAIRDVSSEMCTFGSDPAHTWEQPLCYDGAEVAKFGFRPGFPVPNESEVYVHVCGTPLVTVEIGLKDGYVEVMPALRWLLDSVPTEIFDVLEPFVRPSAVP